MEWTGSGSEEVIREAVVYRLGKKLQYLHSYGRQSGYGNQIARKYSASGARIGIARRRVVYLAVAIRNVIEVLTKVAVSCCGGASAENSGCRNRYVIGHTVGLANSVIIGEEERFILDHR